MSWWQEYQGLFVVGALVALLVLRWAVRRWSRRFVARSADNAARGVTWDTAGNPFVDKLLASLATEVHLDTDVDGAERVLAATSFPRWWKPAGPREWSITEGDLTTSAALVGADDGSRLVLRSAVHNNGMPTSEGDWRKLRKAVLRAAGAEGVGAREVPGPPLAREERRWVRA